MSFRRRMVLLAAGAVAAAIVIASVVVYVVTGNELRGQIDTSLRQKLTPGPQAVQIQTMTLSSAAAREAEARKASCRPGDCRGSPSAGQRRETPTPAGRTRPAGKRRRGKFRPGKRWGESPWGNGLDRRQRRVRAGRPRRESATLGVHVQVSPFNQLVLPTPEARRRHRLRPAVPVQRAGSALRKQGIAAPGHRRDSRRGRGPP